MKKAKVLRRDKMGYWKWWWKKNDWVLPIIFGLMGVAGVFGFICLIVTYLVFGAILGIGIILLLIIGLYINSYKNYKKTLVV